MKTTKVIISLAVAAIVLCAVAWFFRIDLLRTIVEKTSPGSPEAVEVPTDSSVACTTNTDCRCRVFTGAEFLLGLQEGRCCLPEDKNRAGCTENYYCADCIYE